MALRLFLYKATLEYFQGGTFQIEIKIFSETITLFLKKLRNAKILPQMCDPLGLKNTFCKLKTKKSEQFW